MMCDCGGGWSARSQLACGSGLYSFRLAECGMFADFAALGRANLISVVSRGLDECEPRIGWSVGEVVVCALCGRELCALRKFKQSHARKNAYFRRIRG